MKIRDIKKLFAGLNTDDNPQFLKDGEFVDSLNVRVASSDETHGIGIMETLQGEIEILLDVAAPIYYGEAIGGDFLYTGFEEVTIGTQTWMKKNYDVAYPGSKVYNDDEANVATYGRLYTHNQVMTSNFCPPGWHVPTEAEIDTLLTYLGGAMLAGGKLKETGLQHWTTPNTGADDISGFSAIPSGKFDLLFELLGDNCLLWLLDEGEPVAPVAINGSAKTPVQFVANWLVVEGATGYRLDVSASAVFAGFVAGWNDKDVGNVLFDTVTGLTPNTPYYYRVRAYNDIGTSPNSNTVTITVQDGLLDADGNVYTYVTIGAQQWLVQNFKSTKYADGTAIPNLSLEADWINEDNSVGHDGAYCWFDNDIANKFRGALYNWYAVDNAHGLAPAGWRVASNADWNTLITALGGESVAGGKLKEIGITNWEAPNIEATDEFGFKAVPTGARNVQFIGYIGDSAEFSYLVTDPGHLPYPSTQAAFWWTSDYNNSQTPPAPVKFYGYYYGMMNNTPSLSLSYETSPVGFAVRMMRDVP